jgi:LuxR family maltose regulon positive regulatory protein
MGAPMSGPEILLATKLHVPAPQPGFVPRPRLAEALGEGLTRGRVLVCAPAGFGKTALLADWARGSGRAVAWVGLDGSDSDPARFWRYVVAALDRVRPGLAGRVGPTSSRSFEELVTALINELAADPGPVDVLLVLDDYHLVDSGPVHESVAYLLENLPPGLRVVVSGRADPPLPLARLRARGQLAELRAADLRFTTEEAAALLGEATGQGLPGTAVTALVTRTEGWAAGLQLAGLSLRGHADPAGFATAFSGSHRFVLDYLADEVLDGQPAEVRAFLLDTSVLDRLSGELCDAVTGRTDSQAMLQDIERAGLFLVPLDEVRGWWRYHHLFADLLRARLLAEQPGRVPALHRAAAAWPMSPRGSRFCRTGSIIEIQALRALALAARGDHASASARWPRRSRSPARAATSGSSSTRARRCTPCSPSCPRPGPAVRTTRRDASTAATWPRSCAPLARQTPGRREREPPRRRAWPTR